MNDFSHLLKYPKKKQGKTFFSKLELFVNGIDQLFDIFCHVSSKRRALKVQHKLRMTTDDFAFYEDQKGPRVGRCLPFVKRMTSSDVLFRRRATVDSAPPITSLMDHISKTDTEDSATTSSAS